ncbi:unnamed protein product [Phytophthora lilii]|uniref:Unnamed protein product n=1 Tax=Phytophthora lilii TaxID=2077276 RepID=A0A9W6TLW3_9STRA|nr:unnamed protein product [Phytophthora lilii]
MAPGTSRGWYTSEAGKGVCCQSDKSPVCIDTSLDHRPKHNGPNEDRVPAANDAKAWVKLHDWADATTQAWTRQAKAEVRRQYRCQSMARLRVLKKSELLQMREERSHLEQKIKQRLAEMNTGSMPFRDDISQREHELYDALHGLALEGDTLRTENAEIHEKLQQHKRLQSLVQDSVADVIPSSDHDPNSLTVYAATNVSIQVLHSFDMDSHVMVCNIPGQVHNRYFQLGCRRVHVAEDGKRSFSSRIALTDSKANARSRAAEGQQPNVKWAGKGGAHMKFTEVDTTTVQVTVQS